MPRRRPLAPARLAALLVMSALVGASAARADVGPVDRTCTAERRCQEGGVECRYVNSDPEAGDLACEEDAERRGLDFVCSRGGGTVGVHIYCPKGKVRKAGCAVDPEGPAGPASLAGLAALLGIAGATRRRRASAR